MSWRETRGLSGRSGWTAPLLFVLAVVCFGCGKPSTPQSRFILGPYLERPGVQEMTVRWTMQVDRKCTVKYGAGTSLTEQTEVGSSETAEDMAPTEYLYRARLAGLKGGTEYRYVVACEGEEVEGSFRTLPEGPGPFTFIAYGDSRTQPDVHQEVVSCFLKHKPLFILHTGDMVETGAYSEWGECFFRPLAEVIRRVPVWPAEGNHEGDAVSLEQLFTFPNGRPYYSFDCGDAHFVCLDTHLYRSREAMLDWCRKDLAASRATWKFVFYHDPTYDVGKHHSRWGRMDFLPVFRRYGVDFVITGHSHSYQRFLPLFTPDENEKHPITHIVTAGGGAPMYRVEADPHMAAAKSAYHYVVFEVDGGTVSMRTLTPDGTEIDSLRVSKRDGKLDEEYLAKAVPETTFGEFMAVISPYLRGLSFKEVPTPGRISTVTFELGAGPFGMSYEIVAEERARAHYEVKPVTGEVEAYETTLVTVGIEPKKPVEVLEGGVVTPYLRLLCAYEIYGQKGKLYSSRLTCPEPAPAGSPPKP